MFSCEKVKKVISVLNIFSIVPVYSTYLDMRLTIKNNHYEVENLENVKSIPEKQNRKHFQNLL